MDKTMTSSYPRLNLFYSKTQWNSSRNNETDQSKMPISPTTRKRTKSKDSYMRITVLFLFLYGSDGCILLLNGWEPLSLAERASRADIVVCSLCTQTYKEFRTQDAGTYTAEFQLTCILKGIRELESLKTERDTSQKYSDTIVGGYFNVSNFGDKKMCYADVTSGETYILFLTVYDGRLSAKYDDLFGAASEQTSDNEEEILSGLGWKPWSYWSTCSRSCGGGIQRRHRRCMKEDPAECEGSDEESRQCNFFSCTGSIDLLSSMGVRSLPSGVTTSPSDPHVYIIDHNARIHTPTSKLVPSVFPREFAILVTAKPELGNRGYLLTIADLLGRTQLGIQVGDNPAFDFSETSVRFPVDFSDGKWHQIAYKVQSQNITLTLDCDLVITRPLLRWAGDVIPRNTVTSLGTGYTDLTGTIAFQGELSQLVLSYNPEAASKQCAPRLARETDQTGLNHSVTLPHRPGPSWETDESEQQLMEETAPPAEFEWSPWSSCSSTCGRGLRARTAFCVGVPYASMLDCGNDMVGTTQTRSCHERRCPAECKKPCENGGTCRKRSRCTCPPGYYGRYCQRVSCVPGCYNGGVCTAPDTCSCPPGYSGPHCQTAQCEPDCANGGRCVRPGMCSCPYGFIPPDCRPVCSSGCHNGGTCIGYNFCDCLPGYAGNLCQTAVCDPLCRAGGRCVAPNTCVCSAGYSGADCSIPTCQPGCQNGGTCLLPFFCLCPPLTYGSHCEKFVCSPPCENGGTCIGLQTCACRAGFSGTRCEREDCHGRCLNGGICSATENTCQCLTGFTGNQCQTRSCYLQQVREPYQQRVRHLHTTFCSYRCGIMGWHTCWRARQIYRHVYKTFYRHVFKCL